MGMYGFLKTLKWAYESEEHYLNQDENQYTEENGYYSYNPTMFTHHGRYVKFVLRGNEYYGENVLFAIENDSVYIIQNNKTYRALQRIDDRKFKLNFEELAFNDGAYESKETLKLIKDISNSMNADQKRYAKTIVLLAKASEYNSKGAKTKAAELFNEAIGILQEQPYVIAKNEETTYIQFWHRNELYGKTIEYKRTISLNDIFFGLA